MEREFISKVNENMHVLDIPPDIGIHTTVHVEDLTKYEEPLPLGDLDTSG